MALLKEILQKSFHQKKEPLTLEGKEVYEYTRVSTKAQLENNSSIENQQAWDCGREQASARHDPDSPEAIANGLLTVHRCRGGLQSGNLR